MNQSAITPHGEIYKGKNFLELLDTEAKLKENVTQLWSSAEKKLQVGTENIYIVIFESIQKERIIGLAKIIESTDSDNSKAGMVHNVIVNEDFRGLGLGKLLMNLVLEYGRAEKYRYLELTSRPFRIAANELYKKIGFELITPAQDESGTNFYRYVYS